MACSEFYFEKPIYVQKHYYYEKPYNWPNAQWYNELPYSIGCMLIGLCNEEVKSEGWV